MSTIRDKEVEPTNIKISIGTIEFDYLLYVTSAPRDYDGFNTLTIHDDGKERHVLIQRRHVEYHLQRYGSGLHYGRPCTDLNATQLEGMMAEKFLDLFIAGRDN
jgi:hypothetical protein